MPAFGLSRPSCPVSYFNSALPVNTWLTGVSDYSGDGKKVGWSTITESDMGTYTVTIIAKDSFCPYPQFGTMSYTLGIATESLDSDVCKQLKEAVLKDSEEPELSLGE